MGNKVSSKLSHILPTVSYEFKMSPFHTVPLMMSKRLVNRSFTTFMIVLRLREKLT